MTISIYIYIYYYYYKLQSFESRSKSLAVSNHLICSGCYDADGKGEYEGKCSSKYKCPPWHLNLIFQENAECKGDDDGQSKEQVKPP